MPVNSKNKGNNGERQVAHKLSEALAPNVFKRIAGSGAVLGGMNSVNLDDYLPAARVAFVGDIFCSNDEGNLFRFAIENKSYKDQPQFSHMFKELNQIEGWLREIDEDCKKLDKEGILIFKWNRTDHFVAVRSHVELPESVKFITLMDGSKVCKLDDVLKFRSFWFKETK